MALGKKIKRKREKKKQCHLPYNIKAVGKNIKWGGGEGDGKLVNENQDFKNTEVGKNVKL